MSPCEILEGFGARQVFRQVRGNYRNPENTNTTRRNVLGSLEEIAVFHSRERMHPVGTQHRYPHKAVTKHGSHISPSSCSHFDEGSSSMASAEAAANEGDICSGPYVETMLERTLTHCGGRRSADRFTARDQPTGAHSVGHPPRFRAGSGDRYEGSKLDPLVVPTAGIIFMSLVRRGPEAPQMQPIPSPAPPRRSRSTLTTTPPRHISTSRSPETTLPRAAPWSGTCTPPSTATARGYR